jgi:hypothetical protein
VRWVCGGCLVGVLWATKTRGWVAHRWPTPLFRAVQPISRKSCKVTYLMMKRLNQGVILTLAICFTFGGLDLYPC